MDQQTQGAIGGGGSILGTLVSLKGASTAATGAREAGSGAQQAAGFQAAQLRTNAGQVQASSQRTSAEQLRQARLSASRALAVAGASGAGVSDTTVQNIISRITGEGKLASLSALYEGDTEAAGMRRQAAAVEYEGATAKTASEYTARGYDLKKASTLLSGAQSMASWFPSEKKEVKTQKAAPITEKSWG